MGGKSVGLQGKIQISVCVLSEDDIKVCCLRGMHFSLGSCGQCALQNNPKLPIHQYDLETQMWEDMEHKQEVVDFDYSSKKFLQSAVCCRLSPVASPTLRFRLTRNATPMQL